MTPDWREKIEIPGRLDEAIAGGMDRGRRPAARRRRFRRWAVNSALSLALAEQILVRCERRPGRHAEHFTLELGADVCGAVAAVEAVVAEHDYLPGYGFDVGDDVRREYDYALAGEGVDEVAEADALARVEPCGGLVEDEQPGLVEHGDGYAYALEHAA